MAKQVGKSDEFVYMYVYHYQLGTDVFEMLPML